MFLPLFLTYSCAMTHKNIILILCRKHLSLPTLDTFISESLKEVTRNELKASLQGSEPHTSLLTHSLQSQQAEIEGRLGPAESTFDILTSVGILLLDPDKLGVFKHLTYFKSCKYPFLNKIVFVKI